MLPSRVQAKQAELTNMSSLTEMTRVQCREAREVMLQRICRDIIDAHDNSPSILMVLHQSGFSDWDQLILCCTIHPDVIDNRLVYSPVKGDPPTRFNYVQQCDRLKWFIKWALYLAVRNNYMPANLDQRGALNRNDFDEFIISSGGKVQ